MASSMAQNMRNDFVLSNIQPETSPGVGFISFRKERREATGLRRQPLRVTRSFAGKVLGHSLLEKSNVRKRGTAP